MPTRPNSLPLLLLFLLTTWSATSAQTPTPSPAPKSQDDVIRVYTELVQTDVMVFDKGGKFVNNLTAKDFELRVDGKPRTIQSFEQIAAGVRPYTPRLPAITLRASTVLPRPISSPMITLRCTSANRAAKLW